MSDHESELNVDIAVRTIDWDWVVRAFIGVFSSREADPRFCDVVHSIVPLKERHPVDEVESSPGVALQVSDDEVYAVLSSADVGVELLDEDS